VGTIEKAGADERDLVKKRERAPSPIFLPDPARPHCLRAWNRLLKGSFGAAVSSQLNQDHFSEGRSGSISFSGTSEASVAEVTRELSSLGFEVWDTCLGDHGVTLTFT